MATRPTGFGLTAELNRKKESKYSNELAEDAFMFIQHYVPDATTSSYDMPSVHESLKDGVNLCKLINALQPDSIKRINESQMPFKQMENIGKFLDAASKYGCSPQDMFQSVDLYEGQNMPQVINGIHALGRQAQKKGMMGIGPKESEQNKREFTSEQLRQGQNIIGLQMGTNKGANQSGQNFGKTRAIID